MKRLLIIAALLMPSLAAAQTKVFFRTIASSIQPVDITTAGIKYQQASNSQGAGIVAMSTTTLTGPRNAQAWPSTDVLKITNQPVIFVSKALSAGVTIAGTITPNIWCVESAATVNAGFRYQVFRWSAAVGGIVSSLGISTDDGVTECGTAAAVRTTPTMTPTSTAFAIGDRIVIVLYQDDAATTTQAAGSVIIDYNAATGVDGDSYLNFTETLSFAAEANNARSIPGN